MRLINVDDYCENVCSCSEICKRDMDIKEGCTIIKMPTAFDKNKVLKELKEIENFHREIYDEQRNKYDLGYFKGCNYAFKIIEKGGDNNESN